MTNKQTPTLPANIMLDKWADIGFNWQGELSTLELPRLSDELCEPSVLQLQCQLQKIEQILWLSYTLSGALKVACQRCLEPLVTDVSGEIRLALLRQEAQISQIQDAEYLLLDEIAREDSARMLPIKELLEDELMLMLPLSAKHADCDLLLTSVGDEIDEQAQEQESPFAALAALKGKLS